MTTIKIELNTKSVNKAIRELKKYKKSLKKKAETFVSELADAGIRAAMVNSGDYGRYILFSKEIRSKGKVVSAVMYGQNLVMVVREWVINKEGDKKTAEVNPILMAEFGSGFKASDVSGAPNAEYVKLTPAGQGTFPEQTHAKDPRGWYWKESLEDDWHHSRGEEPTMPMFNAYLAMKDEVETIAKKVFGA